MRLSGVVLSVLLCGQCVGATIYVDGDVPSSGDGSSWAAAMQTISEALVAAATGDEIWVAEGEYVESSWLEMKSHVAVYGGFTGVETLLEERDFAANTTTLRRESWTGGVVLMSDLTDARFDGFEIPGGPGGGVDCWNATGPCVVANCYIHGFSSTGEGGGVFVYISPDFTIENCTISWNQADQGGGISATISDRLRVINTTIAHNDSTTSYTSLGGGGIQVDNSDDVEIRGCHFLSNTAVSLGGGFHTWSTSGTIADCTFEGNSASVGGGVSSFMAETTITGCTVESNTASEEGGGISLYALYSEVPNEISDCVIEGNVAGTYGGGVYLRNTDASLMTFTRCTIMGNQADLDGGGVGEGLSSPGNDALITDSILCDNTALRDGGGIAWAVDPQRCLIFNNHATNNGGGVYFGLIVDSTVACNSAGGLGGGCFGGSFHRSAISGNRTDSDGGGSFGGEAFNSVFTGNYAAGNGGGLYNQDDLDIYNCVFKDNDAGGDGGGIWLEYTATHDMVIANTAFQNNTKHGIYEAGASSLDPRVNGCLFYQNPNGAYYDGDIPQSYASSSLINANVSNSNNNVDGNPMFIMGRSGTWVGSPALETSPLRTIFTYSGAPVPADSLVGAIINVNTSQRRHSVIIANTGSTIEVAGDLLAVAGAGDTFQVQGFRPALGSACIDRGVPHRQTYAPAIRIPVVDIEGNIRPIDTLGYGNDALKPAYDIGLYEYQETFDPGPTATLQYPGLLVISNNNYRVNLYDPFVGAFRGICVTPGVTALDTATSVAFGHDQNIYVSCYVSNRILRIDGETGAFEDIFISGGELNRPVDMLFAPNGDLIVLQQPSYYWTPYGFMLRFDGETGEFIQRFADPYNFYPTAMTIGPDGDIFVTDVTSSGRITRHDAKTGLYLGVFCEHYSLYSPRDIAYGPDGNLYVVNGHNEVIRIDGRTGEYLAEVIPEEMGLSNLRGISFGFDGRMYLSIAGDDRVAIHDSTTGEFVEDFIPAGSGDLDAPTQLLFVGRSGVLTGADGWQNYE